MTNFGMPVPFQGTFLDFDQAAREITDVLADRTHYVFGMGEDNYSTAQLLSHLGKVQGGTAYVDRGAAAILRLTGPDFSVFGGLIAGTTEDVVAIVTVPKTTPTAEIQACLPSAFTLPADGSRDVIVGHSGRFGANVAIPQLLIDALQEGDPELFAQLTVAGEAEPA